MLSRWLGRGKRRRAFVGGFSTRRWGRPRNLRRPNFSACSPMRSYGARASPQSKADLKGVNVMRINRLGLLTSIALLSFAVHIQAQGKADWKKPDVSGVVSAISANGKLLTIQTSKGDKNQAAQGATVQMPAADQITYSAVARGGDSPREGYVAQVWLEPGANDRAARISFTGHESLKSLA